MKIKPLLNKIKEHFNIEKLIVLGISSWFFTTYLLFFFSTQKITSLEYMKQYSFYTVTGIILAVFLLLSGLDFALKIRKLDVGLLTVLSTMYFIQSVIFNSDFLYSLSVITVLFGVYFYAFCIRRIKIPHIPNVPTVVTVIIIGVLFTLFNALIGYCRYMAFRAPCFDFGIFCQMFENMKDTFIPMTTCERYIPLSHFAVHISPIYYLILPIYMVFPSPVTLQIAQAVIVGSGIIPLYLICRHFNLSNKITIALSLCYAFYPALTGGMSYDIHENAFLTPLILWMLYFVEKKKLWRTLLFAVLILFVKEDAPVYVAVIGLYMMFSRKEYKKGAGIFALAVAYFIGVILLLNSFGQGAMMNRYQNYIYESGGGFLTIIKSIILNPAYLLNECFTVEKLVFALKVLVPVAFLPFVTRKYSRFILLIPFLLFNMMSDYVYQHDINYQYVFGVSALFFFLTAKNLSDMKIHFREMLAVFAAAASLCVFACTSFGHSTYFAYFREREEVYKNYITMDEAIDSVPKDATVYASTFLIPHMYDFKELYQISETNYSLADYIVLDLRYNEWREMDKDCVNAGYECKFYLDSIIAVYETPHYSAD